MVLNIFILVNKELEIEKIIFYQWMYLVDRVWWFNVEVSKWIVRLMLSSIVLMFWIV